MLKNLAVISIFYLTPIVTNAQYFSGPVSSAMGGAGRAAVQALDVTTLNPAILPHLNTYQIGAIFQEANWDGTQFVHRLGGSVVDSNPDVVIPAAVSYTQGAENFSGASFKQTDLRLSIAKYFPPYVSLGFTYRHWVDTYGSGFERVDNNYTLGTLITLSPQIGLAVVYENMGNDSDPRTQPVLSVAGNVVIQKFLRIRGDISQPMADNPQIAKIFMAGMETELVETIFFRVGHQWDNFRGKRFLTAGFGIDGPKLKLDYSTQKNLDYDQGWGHFVDLTMEF